MDSDDSTDLSDFGPGTETCLFGDEQTEIPQELCLSGEIFCDVVNLDTWEDELNEDQRRQLMKLLPNFPTDNEEEKEETIRQLFTGENFKFGNPCYTFFRQLKAGYYCPETVRYHKIFNKALYKEYKIQQQRYHTQLLKDLLVSRYKLLGQTDNLPPGGKLESVRTKSPPPKDRSLQYKVKKRFHKIIQDVNSECGCQDLSSEEEEAYLFSAAMKKRPVKADPEDTLKVYSTVDSPPVLVPVPGSLGNDKQDRVPSPIDLDEIDLKNMLKKHRKRKASGFEAPDLETKGLNLQDITMRVHPNKRLAKQMNLLDGPVAPSVVQKRKKPAMDKKRRKRKFSSLHHVVSGSLPTIKSARLEPVLFRSPVYRADEEAILDPKSDLNLDPPDLIINRQQQGSRGQTRGQGQVFPLFPSFFSFLKKLFMEAADQKVTTIRLEEQVQDWQESTSSQENSWINFEESWVDQVLSALKFLSGDVVGLSLENFVPLIDYKERAQQWKWIGEGRDSDENLLPLCNHWLRNKMDYKFDKIHGTSDPTVPPPRMITTYTVKASTVAEKADFRRQERERFLNPHKAHTFRLHGYESIVGPVKGVYSKDSSTTKAREHALLIKERPNYVTILTLVRDSAARLPNGEGTRCDICELLKDSGYILPYVEDNQINTVVSGALDRLHYEKDPCVKYCGNRKLWIYLHRNRSMHEFEQIHQAHGKAVKAKKALHKKPVTKKAKVDPSVAHAIEHKAPPLPPQVSSPSAPPIKNLTRERGAPMSASEQLAVLNARGSRGQRARHQNEGGDPDELNAFNQALSAAEQQQRMLAYLQQSRMASNPFTMASAAADETAVSKLSPHKHQVQTAAIDTGQRVVSQSPQTPVEVTPTSNLTSPQVARPHMQSPVKPASTPTSSHMYSPSTPMGGKPMVAQLIQQIAANSTSASTSATSHMISMGNLLSNQQKARSTTAQTQAHAQTLVQTQAHAQVQARVQVQVPPAHAHTQPEAEARTHQGTTSFQIQGSQITPSPTKQSALRLTPQSGKPISILSQAAALHQQQTLLQIQQQHFRQQQQLQQQQQGKVSTSPDRASRVITLAPPGGGKPMQFISGKQAMQQVPGKPGSGKPLTMVTRFPGKPFSMATHGGKPFTMTTQGGKPITMTIQDGKLVPVSMATQIGGKPMMISTGGGKPMMMSTGGGKPMMMSTGKPMGGKPFNIGGKPVYLHQVSQSGQGQRSASVGKPGTMIGQILKSGGIVKTTASTLSTSGSSTPSGSPLKASSTTHSNAHIAAISKIVAATSNLNPQLIKNDPSTPVQSSQASAIVSQMGKPQNIQVLRKVISQSGGKPSQMAYVISPPSGPGPGPGPKQSLGSSSSPGPGLGSGASPGQAKSKIAGPVYARIITPPHTVSRPASISPRARTPPAQHTLQMISSLESQLTKSPLPSTGSGVGRTVSPLLSTGSVVGSTVSIAVSSTVKTPTELNLSILPPQHQSQVTKTDEGQ